jgi:Tfp pilus assembly major pilin PilA
MRLKSIALTTFLITLSACDAPPGYISKSTEVDSYVGRGKFVSACVGVQMEDDDAIREYTATRLAKEPESEIATTCVCDAIYEAEYDYWDPAVVRGLKDTDRADLTLCLAPAIVNTEVDDRVHLVHGFAMMHRETAMPVLADAIPSEKDVEVKAAMVTALRASSGHEKMLMALLQNDGSGEVRAAAATALKHIKTETVTSAMVSAATEDESGAVRAVALDAVVRLRTAETDSMVCNAMLNDKDEVVRLAAVEAYQGTSRKVALDCLRKRATTMETSGTVREAILATLGASPSDKAADILCDIVGPWSRMYIRGQIFNQITGSDVVKAQNDRDYERSFACVQKALRSGGYSCYARNYLGHWMKELGGSAATPWCPGMVRL